MAVCPECTYEIHVGDDLEKGDIIECEECETPLEVVGLDPIELDVSIDDDEDDYYHDDEDEY